MMMIKRMFLKPSHTQQTSSLLKPPPLIRSIAAAMSYSSGAKPLHHPKADTSSSSAPVSHIVFTKASADNSYPIRTLSAVLGSEEAAKEAMVYDFEDGINDHFSAVVTPENAVQLLKQPGVLHVIRSRVNRMELRRK
ncbi:uncharacterized protein LOC130723642 [Lotus japonicus]|uniref:uncharacterized protein LOC130723642 n=1 Tax=Lotus japonicus TaxID=34305 RepID=UPI00258ABE5C|nr:uncharacterized protein LOC130723642 [Lotus japonicus]